MPFSRLCSSLSLVAVLAAASVISAQSSITIGEITVQLTEGLDSATNPKGISHGVVTKSSNPAIPVRTAVVAGLGSDPVNGGYTAKLLAISINGRTVPAASSEVALAPDVLAKLPSFLRGQNQTKNAVSGTHVFLPAQTFIKFTLAEPPPSQPNTTRRADSLGETSAQAPVASWKFYSMKDGIFPGHGAGITGVAEVNGRRGPARLSISCTVFNYTSTPIPSASVKYEMQVPRGLINFPTEQLGCEGDGAGNDFGRIQVGTQAALKGDFCYDGGELPKNPNEMITIGIQPSDSKAVVKSPGTPLQISLRLPDTQADAFTARFRLPQDGAALDAMTDPCFEIIDEQARKEKAAVVVSCPEVPGKELHGVDVLVGSAMTKLAPDPDNDIGIAWNLPKKTSKRPVPPKTTLACYYGTGPRTTTSPHEALDKKLLPIPPTAAFCVFREDGHCSTKDGHS